jgi:outer membrane protein OmpA-like peptidoglycan-associated protein
MLKNARLLAPCLATLVLSACAVTPPADRGATTTAPTRPAATQLDWAAIANGFSDLTTAHGAQITIEPAGGLRLSIPAADGFESASAELRPELESSLDALVPPLKARLELKAEILGHTDSIGREGYNMLLSRQRARAVRDYLMNAGIDAMRLSADGRGETEPVADNDTPEGRSRNRRVEIRLFVQG